VVEMGFFCERPRRLFGEGNSAVEIEGSFLGETGLFCERSRVLL